MGPSRPDPAHQAADRRQRAAHRSRSGGRTRGRSRPIFLKAGEKIPDLEKRNEETPKSEWVEGFDGKPKGPWQAQHIVYLVDPISIDQYTYPTATIGGGIAVRELIDRIIWMRRFRGNAVYPIVQLTTRFMKTRYGGTPASAFRDRELDQVRARRQRHDPGRRSASAAAATAGRAGSRQPRPTRQRRWRPCCTPSARKRSNRRALKEEMQDEIPF